MSPVYDETQGDELAIVLRLIEDAWLKGTPPPPVFPGIPENQVKLREVLNEILRVQSFALALANGDLSKTLEAKGIMPGCLKSLHASLRHLTWQTRMIAAGDFSQRVEFMGDFAEAFNSMVCSLEEARGQLQQHERDLSEANSKLRAEIEERLQAEERLHSVNQSLRDRLEEIQVLQAKLREQAIRDPLTNLFNRRYLEETLERELSRVRRNGEPLSVMMMDIDYFKRLNDSFGHKAGDLVLVGLGELLRVKTRQADIACRYGGEEFVVVMPTASLEVAVSRAEQVRESFAALEVAYGGNVLHATLSIGIAAFPIHGAISGDLFLAADQALYAAKAGGRNCHRVATAESSSSTRSGQA